MEMEFQRIFQRMLISKCQKRLEELKPFIITVCCFLLHVQMAELQCRFIALNCFSKNKKFVNDYCIEVDTDSKPFVEQGKSVFCQHVKRCGSKIEIGSDVPIFFKKQIIAVGKSILSSNMIKTQSRGMAIRVRDSLKSQNDGDESS